MTAEETCCICSTPRPARPERAVVRPNVRQFAHLRFHVWRCPNCRSIHAEESVDLAAFYANYPFFRQQLDTLLRWGYRRLLRRLRRAGVGPTTRILDYGCGSGHLVKYLQENGLQAFGYDPYSVTHNDESLLNSRYDCVIAQDVIEHAENPLAMLKTLESFAKPGGLIAIGTPNADGIDLHRPAKYIHPLHQPYHRHIFSFHALKQRAGDLGWTLERFYPTPYTNMPGLSLPFLHHYMRCFDTTIDVLFDKPLRSWRFWLSPETLFYLLLGYFLCDDADVVALFRVGVAE